MPPVRAHAFSCESGTTLSERPPESFHEAKHAHDEVVAAAYRAQGDALLIDSQAKMRLADEYDDAQPDGAERGGRPKTVPEENGFTAAEAGLDRKQIYEARQIRDAEAADPGIIRRTV